MRPVILIKKILIRKRCIPNRDKNAILSHIFELSFIEAEQELQLPLTMFQVKNIHQLIQITLTIMFDQVPAKKKRKRNPP